MKDKAMNRVAIYARYSGDPNYSTARQQLETCREFARASSLKIVDEYVDARHSVGMKRPEFERMLIDAGTRRFNIIVTENFDRITRDLTTAAMLISMPSVRFLVVSDRVIEEFRELKKRHRQTI